MENKSQKTVRLLFLENGINPNLPFQGKHQALKLSAISDKE